MDICKNDDISFETAKYSYNELIEIKDSILKRGQEIMKNDIITNEATEGDSGGLLYSVSGSNARVAGIVCGGDDTYSYYSNAALMPWDIWPTD